MMLIQRADADADAQHKTMGSVSGPCGMAARNHAGTMCIWQYSGHIAREATTDGSEAACVA